MGSPLVVGFGERQDNAGHQDRQAKEGADESFPECKGRRNLDNCPNGRLPMERGPKW